MRINRVTTVLWVLLVAGCGGSAKTPSGESSQALAPPPPVAVGKSEKKATAPAPPKTIASTDNVEKAEVGVGKKGRGYGGDPVTEPIRQYFRSGDRIHFLMMEKALRDFNVLNGRAPKSHEEFMKEVIEKNAIQLPELPAGDEYVFDPKSGKTGELMVRHKK